MAELSEIRTLAQKLFVQCRSRDAPSSYKLLATSVRSLRNALEEVEEDYDPTRTLGPDDVTLLNQIGRSHDILARLDQSLQAYRSAGQGNVNMNAVSDLKTALDVAAHQLKVAFEATTTGVIPLKLETGNFAGPSRPSASVEDSSASRSRHSSIWSLANKEDARSPGASDATSVHTDRLERAVSEEKQPTSPSGSSGTDARGSTAFGAPFADPLSMGIEAATSFILGGNDDDLEMSAYARPQSRSRAESNVSATTELFVSAPASPEMERKPAAPSIDSTATGNTQVAIQGASLASTNTKDLEHAESNPATPSEWPQPPTVDLEDRHLSPETATRQLTVQRSLSNSRPSNRAESEVKVASLASSTTDYYTVGTAEGTLENEPDSTGETAVEGGQLPDFFRNSILGSSGTVLSTLDAGESASSMSRATHLGKERARSGMGGSDSSDTDAADFAEDLGRTMDAALAGEQQIAMLKPLPQSPATEDQLSSNEQQIPQPSPPPPTRRPPPPPPAPKTKRSRPNVKLSSAKSKYRIANDAEGDSSSDEEIYSSSHSSSTAKVTNSSPAQSPPITTPKIHIDQSALDHPDPEDEIDTTRVVAVRVSRDIEDAGGGARHPSQATSASLTTMDPSAPSSVAPGPQIQPNTPNPIARKPIAPPPTPPRSATSSSTPQSPQSPPLPRSVQKRINAAVQAGDRMLAKEIETQFKQGTKALPIKSQSPPIPGQSPPKQSKPPPVPPRPSKSRYNRPRAATAISSVSAASDKETAALESGLEPSDRTLYKRSSNSRLSPRVSADTALNVDDSTALSANGTRHMRSLSTSHLPSPQFSVPSTRPFPPTGLEARPLTGWYGPCADQTPQSELDAERVEHICHFWNNMQWDSAEQYLMGYLESLIEADNIPVARRVRHLLGVGASFKGDFGSAITYFLSNLEIREPSDLSRPGNGEACYWLGDLYAMQNQRLEAVIAYSAAQWGGIFIDREDSNLIDVVRAEQSAVQMGTSKSAYQLQWALSPKDGCGSILDPQILPAPVVKYLFEVEPRRDSRRPAVQLDSNKPRASAFFSLCSSPQVAKFRRNRIEPEHFVAAGPWPVQYDPTFALANVRRERLLSAEMDLLAFFSSKDAEAKMPKKSPMSSSSIDCYSSSDLVWLITAIRESLSMLEMEWSEVANDQGAWFIVRHALMDGPWKAAAMKIATVHYFAIALFRQSFRSSYGVEVCSHGISSARILEPSNLDYERGAHQGEAHRIKKLIKETLEEAEKRKPKSRVWKRQSSIGLGITRSSSSDDQPMKVSTDEGRPPPMPARPRS